MQVQKPAMSRRLAALDWRELGGALDDCGFAVTPPVLTSSECSELIALYPHDKRFRSRVVMERYRFGVGDYAYFARPLPAVVAALRTALYARVVTVANRWRAAMGSQEEFPPSLRAFSARCAAAGQSKPTPLLLRYREGGYNRLHRDSYGEIMFPLQATVFLSRRGRDYRGGESLLVENHPRSQSVGHSLSPQRGSVLLFASDERPVRGARGYYRARMRHGVSRVTHGTRYSLGLIFHDAK